MRTEIPLDEYISRELSYKEYVKSISTPFDAISYYKYFGHDGIFDELFVNDYFKYMLRYPQIYFQKTHNSEYPKEITKELYENKNRFKSKIFNTPFKPETLYDLKDFERLFSNKVFINREGNFTIRSSNFHFVANFNGQLYIPDKETLEKLNVS